MKSSSFNNKQFELHIPSKIRLAKEISNHFRDVSSYIPKDHRDRPNPLTQIHNAYNIKYDTLLYQKNRSNFHRW